LSFPSLPLVLLSLLDLGRASIFLFLVFFLCTLLWSFSFFSSSFVVSFFSFSFSFLFIYLFFSFFLPVGLTPFFLMRREEKVCGNATAVGPFRSEQNGQQTCFRAVIKGILMESMGYERNALRNNYTVELNRSRYGLVKEFHIVQGRLFAEVLLLTRKLDSGCETIKKLVLTGDRQTVSVDDIVEGPLMTISCGEILSLIQLRPSPEAT
jgi:hypothetical protein